MIMVTANLTNFTKLRNSILFANYSNRCSHFIRVICQKLTCAASRNSLNSPLRIYVLLLAAVLAVGCRSTRQAVVATPEAATQPQEPPRRELTVTTFTAMVNGISATGQVRMAEDSVIWLSVTKLVELGRGLATQDSVWLSVPLADRYFAGSYADLQRITKRRLSYADLQAMVAADDAGEQIEALAAAMGYEAKVYITGRRKVERLTFPFRKWQ